MRRVAAARTPSTLATCRLGYLVVAGVFLVSRPSTDRWLQSLWAACRASEYVRHDSFEPVLATLAFSFWINMWRAFDLFFPSLHRWKLMGPPRPEREFKGQGRLAFLLRPGFSNIAVLAYLAPLFIVDYLYPRRVLPVVAPTSLELLCGVTSSVALYDFLFYFVHVAMHRSAFLYRHVHSVHHQQHNLSAHETVHHSFADGALQVAANIVAIRSLGLHPMTRALHNVVITYMLTETHSGYDMPWMLHNVLPHGLLGGSPAHEEHHRCGDCQHQQFFTYLGWVSVLIWPAAQWHVEPQRQPSPSNGKLRWPKKKKRKKAGAAGAARTCRVGRRDAIQRDRVVRYTCVS